MENLVFTQVFDGFSWSGPKNNPKYSLKWSQIDPGGSKIDPRGSKIDPGVMPEVPLGYPWVPLGSQTLPEGVIWEHF